MRFRDLNGLCFGKLQVIRRVENQGIQTVWLCSCECGKEARVISQNLTSGRQVSCGCHGIEKKTIHGATKYGTVTSEYSSWKAMKSRCLLKNHKHYEHYGGRGISVCERWLNSFENFLEDMGNKPTPKHSIERDDVNGNYEPSNCRWSTQSEQISNQRLRQDNTSGHKGISFVKRTGRWHAYLNRNKGSRLNIGLYDNLQDAITARENAVIEYLNSQSSN